MPPGPPNLPKNQKIPGLGGLGVQGVRPPYFPCVGKLELLLQGVVWALCGANSLFGRAGTVQPPAKVTLACLHKENRGA